MSLKNNYFQDSLDEKAGLDEKMITYIEQFLTEFIKNLKFGKKNEQSRIYRIYTFFSEIPTGPQDATFNMCYSRELHKSPI